MLARKAISGSTGKTECACSEVSLDAVAKAKAKIRENRVARGIDWGKQNAPAQSRARLDGAGGPQLFAQTEFRTRAVADDSMLIRVLLLWMSILPLSLAQSGDASGASASGSQPVKSGAAPAKPVPPLAPSNKRVLRRAGIFFISCAACHQPHGLGLEGLAPPLVESEWVLGSSNV